MSTKAGITALITLGLLILSSFLFFKLQIKSENKVQASNKELAAIVTPTPTLIPSPTVFSTPTHMPLSKKEYVIAAFGDSMIDTMGEYLQYLDKELKQKYPGTSFKFYNYGIGSQTVEEGLGRWGHNFSYQSRSYPPITNISADVIILGSFSYNPFLEHDVTKHTLLLNQLVELAKKTGASVYLLNEIAPLYDKFGQGPHGPNMTLENAHAQANRILEQLETVAGVAKSEGVTLIDALTPTQVNGRYGNASLINSDDGIHPSIEGEEFMADLIADVIVLK